MSGALIVLAAAEVAPVVTVVGISRGWLDPVTAFFFFSFSFCSGGASSCPSPAWSPPTAAVGSFFNVFQSNT